MNRKPASLTKPMIWATAGMAVGAIFLAAANRPSQANNGASLFQCIEMIRNNQPAPCIPHLPSPPIPRH